MAGFTVPLTKNVRQMLVLERYATDEYLRQDNKEILDFV